GTQVGPSLTAMLAAILTSAMTYVRASFFFSSRRRHTRSKRDWSSDVCSSDLAQPAGGHREPGAVRCSGAGLRRRGRRPVAVRGRSEERRVGKEWGCGWGARRKEKKTEIRGEDTTTGRGTRAKSGRDGKRWRRG